MPSASVTASFTRSVKSLSHRSNLVMPTPITHTLRLAMGEEPTGGDRAGQDHETTRGARAGADRERAPTAPPSQPRVASDESSTLVVDRNLRNGRKVWATTESIRLPFEPREASHPIGASTPHM